MNRRACGRRLPHSRPRCPVYALRGAWERVCGVSSLVAALFGGICLGVADSEFYVARRVSGWVLSRRNDEIMLIGAVLGIALVLCGVFAGIAGRRTWQGRTGIAVSATAGALAFVAAIVPSS